MYELTKKASFILYLHNILVLLSLSDHWITQVWLRVKSTSPNYFRDRVDVSTYRIKVEGHKRGNSVSGSTK
jgi:hypothetical protein